MSQTLPSSHARPAARLPRLAARPAPQGFTLIELITVVGILLLLVAVSIPTLSTTQGANVRTAERQIQAGAYLARQTAVTTRQRIVFCIPVQWVATNSYVRKDMLFRSFVLFGEATSGVSRPDSIVGKVEVLPPGVVFTNSFPGWSTWDFVDDNNNVLFKGYGFRYASTGTIYWKDAGKSYNMILTEGDVKDTGAVTYRAKPIVSTSSVNSVTGRITIP